MTDEKLASRWLVSADWLASHLNDPNVIVLDASYYLANAKRDADAEFLAGHIPGAQRFDIDLGVDLGRLQRKVPQDPRDGLQRGPDLQQARGHRMAERVQPLPGLGGQGDPRPLAVEGQDVMEVIRVAERLDRGLQP